MAKSVKENAVDQATYLTSDNVVEFDVKSVLLEALEVFRSNQLLAQGEYEQKLDLIENPEKRQDLLAEPETPEELAAIAKEQGPVIVSVKNFTKKYPKTDRPAVDDLSFEIREGQFHAFIGANGAGKTTTMKALVGAYARPKWKGQITIGGYDNQDARAKAKIGYVPEKAVFPNNFTTKQYLENTARLSGLSNQKAKEFCAKTLADFKMEKLANKRPEKFSSGQKKKILCAQALCHNPDVLILDEPAANLDPIARFELFEMLKQIQAQGKSIFISSHILAEVGQYANYATILDGGKIVYSGPLTKRTNLEKLYRKYVLVGSVHTANDPVNEN